jgi:endoglucanase
MKTWSRACRLAAASLAAVLLCACLASCATADSRAAAAALEAFAPMPSGSPPGASPQALALAKSLGRGVNFGNMLEAPTEGAWGIHLQDEFADKAVEAGFQSVRLPVRWSNHAALTGDATIDEAFARRVDHAVDLLLARGLVVVLNMHHYRQLDGDRLDPAELEVQPSVVRLRFLNLWKQIAQRYRDKPANLVFELYNEPHGEQNERWNDLAARALNAVRQTNQTRVVVIGPTHWNSADALDKLVLPNDPHLIVTVHNYQPFEFSHQGAEWESRSASWLGTPCCSAAQQAQLRAPLDVAAAWSARHRYPIYLGEFGSYSKAAMPARVAYTRLMRDEAEKRGMSWAYWEFASGFGLYDPQTRTWRTPLRDALLGS